MEIKGDCQNIAINPGMVKRIKLFLSTDSQIEKGYVNKPAVEIYLNGVESEDKIVINFESDDKAQNYYNKLELAIPLFYLDRIP